ncbi:acyltransferase family protein [Iodobacter sp. HSC-16F04]|uniref:Acyltransferase family protein n=1 Tax=Iodobacter violaceini TaxID=3044271 RepID=A0ABX0KV15_9NEIS|nr:acyltransferase family protein [Iodobacter violacea]NHQ88511.1 acyltransferase family protein [Iodobacter violacea]
MIKNKLIHIEYMRVFFAFCILIVHLKGNILPQWNSLHFTDVNFFTKSMYFIFNLAPHVVNCGFFCVSGYLVAFIHWDKILSGSFDVRKFITTRFYLLYLPYVLIILLGSVIEFLYSGKLNFWVNFQQIFFYGGDWLNLPKVNYYLWFMIYEFWFSFFVVSAYLLKRGATHNKIFGGLLILLFFMLVFFKFDTDFVLAWFVSFLFGCVSNRIRVVPNRLLCIVSILFFIVLYKLSSHYNVIDIGYFSKLFLYVSFVIFGYILVEKKMARLAKNSLEKCVLVMSKYTFSLYLTQGVVIYLYNIYYVQENRLDFNVFKDFMFCFLLCVFVAYLYKKTIIDMFSFFMKKNKLLTENVNAKSL